MIHGTALELFAEQLRYSNGVTGVAIGAGRRKMVFGDCTGPPDAEWELCGTSVEVWGEQGPMVHSIAELARLVDMRQQEVDDLAEALTVANDRQLRLYELARMHLDTLDAASTIRRVLAYACELTDSDVAVVVGPDGEVWRSTTRADSDMEWVVSHALGQFALSQPSIQHSMDGLRRVLMSGFKVEDQTFVVAVGCFEGVSYGTSQRKILEALCGALGSALRLVRLHRRELESAVLENEHRAATLLAAAVIPLEFPRLEGIDVSAATIPARSVGGDFYTAVLRSGEFRFAVGDVAGKGLPAAVLMTNAVGAANSVLERNPARDPLTLLREISEDLSALLLSTDRFVTMLVGSARTVGNESGDVELRLANAGHSPVLVVRRHGVEVVPPICPPVGVAPIGRGTSVRVRLRPGEYLFAGSDGLVDQLDEQGEMFGIERLIAVLGQHVSAEDQVAASIEAVSLHAGTTQKTDDQTVFLIRNIGRAPT